jgi:hypothetical protein
MRTKLLVPLALSLLFLNTANGQQKAEGHGCADVPGETSATYRFRHVGETIEIVIRGQGAPAGSGDGDAECEPVALQLHWANGRNNGSNFNVTFLDGFNKPVFARQVSAFLTGVLHLPLASFEPQPVYGASLALISVPSTITIQAVPPFAAPATLSYTVTRIARRRSPDSSGRRQAAETKEENEIVSIRNTKRLIGSSQLPLVQIELKTSRPFPVRDVPLQVQIGTKVFVDELSGDHTGRKLMLSLTPEMFAELKDGDEVLAFFGKRADGGEVWSFGKLRKSSRQEP